MKILIFMALVGCCALQAEAKVISTSISQGVEAGVSSGIGRSGVFFPKDLMGSGSTGASLLGVGKSVGRAVGEGYSKGSSASKALLASGQAALGAGAPCFKER